MNDVQKALKANKTKSIFWREALSELAKEMHVPITIDASRMARVQEMVERGSLDRDGALECIRLMLRTGLDPDLIFQAFDLRRSKETYKELAERALGSATPSLHIERRA